MAMINYFIKFILIFLLVFTPIVFGAADLWAFSVMELGILLMIILRTIQKSVLPPQSAFPSWAKASEGERNPWPPKLSERRRPHSDGPRRPNGRSFSFGGFNLK
jgi:hypothetical protein